MTQNPDKPQLAQRRYKQGETERNSSQARPSEEDQFADHYVEHPGCPGARSCEIFRRERTRAAS